MLIGIIALALYLFVGFGLYLMILGESEKIKESQNWIATTAQIQKLDYGNVSEDDGECYRTDIIYEYSVEGKNYQSSNIAFGYMGTPNKVHHKKIYDILATKTMIRIYYNPHNPRESIISKTPNPHSFTITINIIIVYIALPLIMIVLSDVDFPLKQYIIPLLLFVGIIIFLILDMYYEKNDNLFLEEIIKS